MSNFLLAESPAFKPGEVWKAADGSAHSVKILSVDRWEAGETEWDYTVHYVVVGGGMPRCRDLWSFQVRYCHAD